MLVLATSNFLHCAKSQIFGSAFARFESVSVGSTPGGAIPLYRLVRFVRPQRVFWSLMGYPN